MGLLPVVSLIKRPKTPPKKSYGKCLRRTQIRQVIWRSSYFPGNCRHFSSQRNVHSVVNLGGVAKTLWRSNSLSQSVFRTAGSFGVTLKPVSRIFKVPKGHHPRGTTLREALRGDLPLRKLCGGLSEGSAGVLRGLCGVLRRSAGFSEVFRGCCPMLVTLGNGCNGRIFRVFVSAFPAFSTFSVFSPSGISSDPCFSGGERDLPHFQHFPCRVRR